MGSSPEAMKNKVKLEVIFFIGAHEALVATHLNLCDNSEDNFLSNRLSHSFSLEGLFEYCKKYRLQTFSRLDFGDNFGPSVPAASFIFKLFPCVQS